MERQQFLGRVRASLTGSKPPAAPPPYNPPIPAADGEGIDLLVEELEKVGGIAHRVASAEEARSAILRILSERGVRSIVRTDTVAVRDLELDGLLTDADIVTTVCNLRHGTPPEELRRAALAADAGITSADYGVAETGTLALLARPGNGRAVSLLPPVHIAVLQAEDVVQDLSMLFRAVQERSELPSALTLVTGPSRTGDIELVLTVGVHGPGEMHLVLVG